MLSSVGQNNNVQRFSAVNALRTSASQLNKPAEKQEQNSAVDNTSDGVKSAPKSLLDRVDVADIRKCAEFVGEFNISDDDIKHAGFVGEFNISDDDIKYGLMYGRSVIAEYLC